LLLGFMTALGTSWRPLLWLSPMLVAGVVLTLVQAARAAKQARFDTKPASKLGRLGLRLTVTWLHVVQPAARLLGRIQHGIGPWSWRGLKGIAPLPPVVSLWSTRWEPTESRLAQLKANLGELGATVSPGGNFDDWDLWIAGGLFGGIRVVAMVEEHGDGKQLFRLRTWPKIPGACLVIEFALMIAAGLAFLDSAAVASAGLAAMGSAVGFLMYTDCAFATSEWSEAVHRCATRDNSLHIIPQSASGKTVR
jgi:hypothetical protein